MAAKLRSYADQNRTAARIILADLARYGGPGSLLDRWMRRTLGDPDAARHAPARAGVPVKVDAEQLESAEKTALAPTIQEMSGLVSDFTEGKSLKEYLESIGDE